MRSNDSDVISSSQFQQAPASLQHTLTEVRKSFSHVAVRCQIVTMLGHVTAVFVCVSGGDDAGSRDFCVRVCQVETMLGRSRDRCVRVCQVETMLGHVTAVHGQLTNSRMQELLLIRSSPR